jgi:phage-related protein
MFDRAKKLQANFFRLDSGREPVREWLLALDRDDRRTVGKDIQKVEFGWPIGMPYCRKLEEGIHEIRSNISAGRIARILFTMSGNRMVLLHAFVKKTQATPKSEFEVARRRMNGTTR